MTAIALFHSALGVRPGVEDAAARLRAAGHDVTVVDQYDGRSFEGYDEAGAFVEEVGFPALMARAEEGVAHLADGFVAVGFSNGAGMAEHIALQRDVAGAVLLSGALPLELLGAASWPSGVPVQVHHTLDDPFRDAAWTASLVASVEASGASIEVVEHEGSGHLFTDASRPDEFDAAATERLFADVLAFCARVAR